MKNLLALLSVGLALASAARGEEPLPAANASNAFGIDLYRRLAQQQEGNVILSPVSISSALSMAWSGADGKTREEIAEVLHLSEIQGGKSGELKRIRRALEEETTGIALDLANAVWVQQGYAKKEYLVRMNEEFSAPVQVVDFSVGAEKIRRRINGWVEEKTQNRIKELVPPGVINKLTRFVLVNAIYFKGSWNTPFEEQLTRDLPFHQSPGKQSTVPTMYTKRRCSYAASDTAQLVALPYKGERFEMLLVVPKPDQALADIEQKLTTAQLAQWRGGMGRQEVLLFLPRFKITLAASLKEPLIELGINKAFKAAEADFGPMSDDPELHVSAVLHKAFIEVNESGTEAAAATGVMMATTSIPRSPPPVVRADHPFLFFINDNLTGAILFMGRVGDPAGEDK